MKHLTGDTLRAIWSYVLRTKNMFIPFGQGIPPRRMYLKMNKYIEEKLIYWNSCKNKQTNHKTTGLWCCAKYLLHKDEWKIGFSYKLQPLHSPSGRRQGPKNLRYDGKELRRLRCVLGIVVYTEEVGEEIKEHLFHTYCKCRARFWEEEVSKTDDTWVQDAQCFQMKRVADAMAPKE